MRYYFLMADFPYYKSKFGEFYTKKEMSSGMTTDCAKSFLLRNINRKETVGIYDMENDEHISSPKDIYNFEGRAHIIFADSPAPLDLDMVWDNSPLGLNSREKVGTDGGTPMVLRFVVTDENNNWIVPVEDLIYERIEDESENPSKILEKYLYVPLIWHDTPQAWEALGRRVSNSRRKTYNKIKNVLTYATKNIPEFRFTHLRVGNGFNPDKVSFTSPLIGGMRLHVISTIMNRHSKFYVSYDKEEPHIGNVNLNKLMLEMIRPLDNRQAVRLREL